MNLVFNGVHALSGEYLRRPIAIDGLPRKRPKRRRRGPVRRLEHGRDPQDLAQAGWGILLAGDVPSAVRQELAPLLELRRAQAGSLYREYVHEPGDDGYAFLARHGRSFGPVDPTRVPYYLLIVGSPEAIPFEVQYQLDVQFAVGRLWLREPGDYKPYVQAVLEAEGRTAPPSRRAVLFAPRHDGDALSALSADEFAAPLARELRDHNAGWTVETRLGEEATKPGLAKLLQEEAPALLLTAGHGVGLYPRDRRQEELQGGLLCQGWSPGKIPKDSLFAADDLPGGTPLGGLVAFLFACYSAGTPRWDSFSHLETGQREPAAARPFVARLPQRLLAAGALAVVGHIDQAWPCSFLWEDTGAQLETFESTLGEVLGGSRVGAAMEYFGQRYAEIASALSPRLEPVVGLPATDLETVKLWIAHNDARSYVLLGDPAVRLGPSSPSPSAPGRPGTSGSPGPSRTADSSA